MTSTFWGDLRLEIGRLEINNLQSLISQIRKLYLDNS